MSSDKILVVHADGVTTLTLNRPEVLNAFDGEMMHGLQHLLREAGKDPAVRAVVITGSGRAFCAGQDLGLGGDPNAKFELKADFLRKGYNVLVAQIRELKKPVIAAVNGVAAGAGANLAFACDLVLAADTASFVQAFVKIGLIPDCGGTFLLPRLVGMQRAAGLAMLGDKLDAETAKQWGLVWDVVPSTVLAEKAHALAARMAKQPTKAIALMKQAFNASVTNDVRAQLEMEAVLQEQAGETDDFHEGVQAFLQKRPPVFRGR